MEREVNININIITLGDPFVGKTSIIKRIKDGTFNEHVNATVGVRLFIIKKKYEKKNIMIFLNFKDTAGQELFQNSIPVQYIRNSHIVLLVFSDIDSLNNLKDRWYSFFKQNANIDNSRFILVGNKSDILGNEKEEILREGQKFAEEINAHFITCSAKSEDNMDNLERFITTEAKNFIDQAEEKLREINEKKKLSLNENNQDKKNDCKC